jgi:hypothetical protein
MPIKESIPPDDTYAGGVVIGDVEYKVRHTQLSGNTESKIAKLRLDLQEYAFDNRQDPRNLPTDDEDYVADINNVPTHIPYYTELEPVPGEPIRERRFYYRPKPQEIWVISRASVCYIVLVLANDPTLGGNDRYSIQVDNLPKI